MTHATFAPRPRRMAGSAQRAPGAVVLMLLSAAGAVVIATAGLRLLLDASILAGQWARMGHDVGSAAIRAAGIAALALAQIVAMLGAVRSRTSRRTGDIWFIRLASGVAVFAFFAAVVLALAGRP